MFDHGDLVLFVAPASVWLLHCCVLHRDIAVSETPILPEDDQNRIVPRHAPGSLLPPGKL